LRIKYSYTLADGRTVHTRKRFIRFDLYRDEEGFYTRAIFRRPIFHKWLNLGPTRITAVAEEHLTESTLFVIWTGDKRIKALDFYLHRRFKKLQDSTK
jgi:hypothetical protein